MKLQKILIVDDEFPVGYLIKINLEAEGYEAVLALGGEEALEKARANPPDLITLDVLMPEMDGFAVLKALHREASLNSIPVIMISVINGIRRKRGIKMGAVDYLFKPIDFENLLHIMRRLQVNEGLP